MDEKQKSHIKEADKNKKAMKSEYNNQWIGTGMRYEEDKRERRDGPGGEDGDKTGKSG